MVNIEGVAAAAAAAAAVGVAVVVAGVAVAAAEEAVAAAGEAVAAAGEAVAAAAAAAGEAVAAADAAAKRHVVPSVGMFAVQRALTALGEAAQMRRTVAVGMSMDRTLRARHLWMAGLTMGLHWT